MGAVNRRMDEWVRLENLDLNTVDVADAESPDGKGCAIPPDASVCRGGHLPGMEAMHAPACVRMAPDKACSSVIDFCPRLQPKSHLFKRWKGFKRSEQQLQGGLSCFELFVPLTVPLRCACFCMRQVEEAARGGGRRRRAPRRV